MNSPLNPRHIAVLLPDLRTGGAERLHVDLAFQWLSRGLEVEFVLRKRQGELFAVLPRGVTVVDLDVDRVRGLLWPLVRYLRQSKPDVLLAAMWPLTVVAPLAARLAGFRGRVVVSEHSPLSMAYAGRGTLHRFSMRASQRLAYPLADARVAVSQGVADDLARLSGLASQEFTVVHNPAATGRAGAVSLPPARVSAMKRPLVLTVGTLKRVKRQDLLIRAFAALPADSRGTLCILGEGPERPQLAALVARLGLQHCVLMPGFIADPQPWYAAADLFVLSSDYEGFGNVLVEAMEHGLPIVSTNCVSGPAEVLANGRYGRLVPVGDVPALTAAMVESLHSQVDAEALKRRARDFAVETIADRYLDLLLPAWREGPAA